MVKEERRAVQRTTHAGTVCSADWKPLTLQQLRFQAAFSLSAVALGLLDPGAGGR